MKEFRPLLKNKNFKYLWASQILSQLTINILNFILLVRLFEKTESTIATSLLWVAYALPAIIIGPFASVSVDLVDRRKMLMVTNLAQSLTIFTYVFLFESRLFLLFGIAMAYSFLNQFYVPAEVASLPSLVKKNDLPQANALFFLTQQAALIFGFGVAGLLKKFLGFSNSLILSSIFLFLAFISVSFLPKMAVYETIPRNFEKAIITFFSRIFEGYRFIKNRKSILFPFLLLLGLSTGLTIVVVNVPAIAKYILKIDVHSAGLLIVVPAGVGAALGALTVPKLLKYGWRKKKVIDVSLSIMTTTIFVFTFIIPILPGFLKVLIGFLSIIFIGASFIGVFIPSQTYLQEVTPGGLRGRVFGNFWFLVTIATIFPVIGSGAITEIFGIQMLLFLLGGMNLTSLFVSKQFGQKLIEENLAIKNEK